MLLMMLERGMHVDEIVFCDTGKEFPQMYEHIADVERYIGRKITKLQTERGFDYWLGEHIKTRGKNKGKCGYGWPDFRNRWCTAALKRDVFNKYFKNKDVIRWIGIAYDERERVNNNKGPGWDIRYPLVDWSITEEQALHYCYDKGFTWDGLYKRFNRVSCYCCPLQRIGELRTLYTHYPALWDEMLAMDKRSYRKFKPNYTLDELTERFAKETGIIHKTQEIAKCLGMSPSTFSKLLGTKLSDDKKKEILRTIDTLAGGGQA
jgi:3'-phosphoadenosine 5'-phosphosulfate sulfotransferase (PAPS reductase)/FAD synthetase